MTDAPRKNAPHPMPDQEILNIDDAAAFLGVSVKTFSKVLREGDVPGRKVGREWKFSRQALVDWIGGARSRSFLDGNGAAGAERTRRRPERGAPVPTKGANKKGSGFSVDDLR